MKVERKWVAEAKKGADSDEIERYLLQLQEDWVANKLDDSLDGETLAKIIGNFGLLGRRSFRVKRRAVTRN